MLSVFTQAMSFCVDCCNMWQAGKVQFAVDCDFSAVLFNIVNSTIPVAVHLQLLMA